MSSRVERYQVDPGERESNQGVGINPPSYAPGPQPSDQRPPVHPDLLAYLRKTYPDRVPEHDPHSMQNSLPIVIAMAKVWGQQELIAHLGSILKQTEK